MISTTVRATHAHAGALRVRLEAVTLRAVDAQCPVPPLTPRVRLRLGAHCGRSTRTTTRSRTGTGPSLGPRDRIRRSRQRQQVRAPAALRMGMMGFNSPGQLPTLTYARDRVEGCEFHVFFKVHTTTMILVRTASMYGSEILVLRLACTSAYLYVQECRGQVVET